MFSPPHRKKPQSNNYHLPKGGCRYILSQPEVKGCACIGFVLNQSIPGQTCDCGHQACYHRTEVEITSVELQEVEALKKKVDFLQKELDKEIQSERVSSLSQTIQKFSKGQGNKRETTDLLFEGQDTSPVLETGIFLDSAAATSQDTNGIMWSFYNTCALTLAKLTAIIKQHPANLNLSSEKMLRFSSESLFLWGESFNMSDLDFLVEWSCDLQEAITQFLAEIALELIQGLFPRLSNSAQSNLQNQINKLSGFVMSMASWQSKNSNTIQQSEDDQQDDDNDEDGENSNFNDMEGCILNIYTSVQCLMDLVPSIEQVLQQRAGDPESLASLDQIDYPKAEVKRNGI